VQSHYSVTLIGGKMAHQKIKTKAKDGDWKDHNLGKRKHQQGAGKKKKKK